jgi:hypothetical protein
MHTEPSTGGDFLATIVWVSESYRRNGQAATSSPWRMGLVLMAPS